MSDPAQLSSSTPAVPVISPMASPSLSSVSPLPSLSEDPAITAPTVVVETPTETAPSDDLKIPDQVLKAVMEDAEISAPTPSLDLKTLNTADLTPPLSGGASIGADPTTPTQSNVRITPITPITVSSQAAASSSPPPAKLPMDQGDGITAPPAPTSLKDAIIDQGHLTADQVSELQIEEANTGKSFETLVIEKNLLTETDLTKARAQFYNIPFVNLDELGVSPEAISQVPESIARRYNLIPFMVNKQERTISVAMKNPLDLSAIDFVEKKTGFRLQPYFATPSELERTIGERYAQNLSSEVNEALKETKLATSTRNLDNLSALSKEVVREAPITKIVETILGFAVKARASDVHIEPQEDRTRVRYRIDGILSEKLILPRSVHEAVLSRIKILSEMKIDEKRLPQDGRFTFSADGSEVDLRVSTLPTVHGEKVVMRLLQKNAAVPSLPDLGLRGQALRDVEEAIRIPHGIILVTGPTGSGKTTTLYSIFHKINTPKVNISTLEDPVEYQIPGINQVQINPQAGLTFASGLRSFLRQDPNIIMVGEVRDKETAELAVQASLTGHLVFSTLHTNSAAGAIPRLLDMEVEPFLLASSLTMALGQRVVRKLNPDYIEEYEPAPAVITDIKAVLGPLFNSWCTQNKKDPDKITLFRSSAKRPETESEYKGRVAIFEVMKITEEINRMILERRPAAEMEKSAISSGMLLMKQDGYLKALEGITTIEEVLRVAEV